jgi:hypothetical protein
LFLVHIGKVGGARALQLGAKGLFKSRVQEGQLRVGTFFSDGGYGIVVGKTALALVERRDEG